MHMSNCVTGNSMDIQPKNRYISDILSLNVSFPSEAFVVLLFL
jgi:hypothetical protein